MKKLLIGFSLSLLLCCCSKNEDKSPERNLEYVGMPIQGPLSKDGVHYESNYNIIWDANRLGIEAGDYTSNPSSFRYYRIEKDKITEKVQLEGSESTLTYKITLEAGTYIIATYMDKDGDLDPFQLLYIDLKERLGGNYQLTSSTCGIFPFRLLDISQEVK